MSGDEWIKHDGGGCLLAFGTRVEVFTMGPIRMIGPAQRFNWGEHEALERVTSYRVICPPLRLEWTARASGDAHPENGMVEVVLNGTWLAGEARTFDWAAVTRWRPYAPDCFGEWPREECGGCLVRDECLAVFRGAE